MKKFKEINLNLTIIDYLLLKQDLLYNYIKIESFKASGRGGQKLNKTDSAVRLIFKPRSLSVTCQKYRSFEKNKTSAYRSLRELIALSVDETVSEHILIQCSNYFRNGIHINSKNQDYPLILSIITGLFLHFNGEHKHVAKNLKVSSSGLIKFIYKNKKFLERINKIREINQIPKLKQ